MLKKAICLICLLAVIAGVSACGKSPETASEPTTEALTHAPAVSADLTTAPPTETETVSETESQRPILQKETTAARTEPTVTEKLPTTVLPLTTIPDEPVKPSSGSFGAEDMTVDVGGVTLTPGSAWSRYADAFGSPKSTVNAPSCHFDGMDTIYTFDGFSIYTYADGNENYIYNIEITTSSVHTRKGGISVGATEQDVLAAYGTGYASKTESLIEYRTGARSLYFSLSDGRVSMIEFYTD